MMVGTDVVASSPYPPTPSFGTRAVSTLEHKVAMLDTPHDDAALMEEMLACLVGMCDCMVPPGVNPFPLSVCPLQHAAA